MCASNEVKCLLYIGFPRVQIAFIRLTWYLVGQRDLGGSYDTILTQMNFSLQYVTCPKGSSIHDNDSYNFLTQRQALESLNGCLTYKSNNLEHETHGWKMTIIFFFFFLHQIHKIIITCHYEDQTKLHISTIAW